MTDNIGSTIALLSFAGTVQRTYDYDTDGNLATSGTGQTTPILYAGGHYVGYGLIHFGARYYQPATGRWTQPDPLDQPGDLGQQNRYLYVANNPINNVDPLGLAKNPKALTHLGTGLTLAGGACVVAGGFTAGAGLAFCGAVTGVGGASVAIASSADAIFGDDDD